MAVAAAAAILEGYASGWPGWTVAGLAFLAAVAILGQQLLSWAHDRRVRLAQIEAALVRWPLTAADADPEELRVERSAIADRYHWKDERAPYVPRDRDAELHDALRDHQFVLVVGPPNAGKSRAAFEAIRDPEGGFAKRRLIVPRRPSDSDRPHPLRDLAALRPPLRVGKRPAVLWLDDIDEYLLAGELDVALLNDWQAGSPSRAVVLATIREGELDALRTPSSEKRAEAGPIGKAIAAVLDRAVPISLSAKPSPDALSRARLRYPDLDFNREGIGSRLLDGQRLLERLRRAKSTYPDGFWLVRAAADWQRTGVLHAVRTSDLEALCALYVEDADSASFDLSAALKWAQAEEESGAALMRLRRTGCTVPDFISDDFEGRLPDSDSYQPIPAFTWNYVIGRADPEELVAVGRSAYASRDPTSRRAACNAWSKAVSAQHPEASPRAALELGLLLEEQGDIAGARSAYQTAVDSDHADVAPQAALALGWLLEEQGDIAGAKSAYQSASDSQHAFAAPTAGFALGRLLEEQGDTAGATSAYQTAIDSHHADAAPYAALALGRMLDKQGDATGATRAYQTAIDSHHADAAPTASLALGRLLEKQGDTAGARDAYQTLIDSHHLVFAPAAAFRLGRLLEEQGETDGARSAYRTALDSPLAEVASQAASALTRLG